MRLLRSNYSDVAMLGKLVTRGRAWPVVGLALHAANGAAFGLLYDEVRRRSATRPRRLARMRPQRLALSLALAEHFTLFPLGYVVDRTHPARGEPGVASLFSGRSLIQATARHALFGAVLGRLAR